MGHAQAPLDHGADDAGLLDAGDVVIPIIPRTLTAGIAVQGCHTVTNGSFKLRTTNASGGAIDPAATSGQFVVVRH